jgi:hypothetical protein
MLTVQTTSATCSSSVISTTRPHNPSHIQITNRSFHHSSPVLWNALPKKLRLYNSGHLGSRSTSVIRNGFSFYFTKSLNPVFSFFSSIVFPPVWTDLLVLTLALFIFIHSHFHYSFIFISLTVFVLFTD